MVIGSFVRIRGLARLALTTAAALALGSCGETEPTEVVVVVTSDLAVPADLDHVLVEVTPPEGDPQTAEADLTTGGLPRSVGIYNPDGPLGPYVVEAFGSSGGSVVVRRRAVFYFTADRSLELELPLLADCVGVSCICTSASLCSTCGEGGVCVSAAVAPQPFDGVERQLSGELDF